MKAKEYIVNLQGVIYHEGRYLLARRSEEEAYVGGILDIPGGKVDENDEQQQDVLRATLSREIQEEVNITVSELVYVLSRVFYALDALVVNVVFLCRYESGEAQALDPQEVTAVAWMTLDEALAHPDVPVWTRDYLLRCDEIRQNDYPDW